jgi:hypothetical protein
VFVILQIGCKSAEAKNANNEGDGQSGQKRFGVKIFQASHKWILLSGKRWWDIVVVLHCRYG